MFKVGDIVECVVNGNGPLTIGKQYTVIYSDNYKTEVKNDSGHFIRYLHHRFKLVTSNHTVASTFKIGDRIRYIGQCYASMKGLAKDTELTIVSLHSDNKPYYVKDNGGKLWRNDLSSSNDFLLLKENNNSEMPSIGQRIKATLEYEFSKPDIIKPCTCESLMLMRQGCTCGAIIKRKWGIGS